MPGLEPGSREGSKHRSRCAHHPRACLASPRRECPELRDPPLTQAASAECRANRRCSFGAFPVRRVHNSSRRAARRPSLPVRQSSKLLPRSPRSRPQPTSCVTCSEHSRIPLRVRPQGRSAVRRSGRLPEALAASLPELLRPLGPRGALRVPFRSLRVRAELRVPFRSLRVRAALRVPFRWSMGSALRVLFRCLAVAALRVLFRRSVLGAALRGPFRCLAGTGPGGLFRCSVGTGLRVLFRWPVAAAPRGPFRCLVPGAGLSELPQRWAVPRSPSGRDSRRRQGFA
jgi:hypothetical protein